MRGEGKTVADRLLAATERLSTVLPRREARLEAQILFAHALGVERSWLIGHDQDLLEPIRAAAILELLRRRQEGEPIAYILGEREFFGRSFKVTPDVLIPRPETELLVELALERMTADDTRYLLDVGVGSGALALSLALERPRARVCGVTATVAARRSATASSWDN